MRKYLVFLIGVLLICSFAGCSNQNNNSPEELNENVGEDTKKDENYVEMGLKEDWEAAGQTGIDENAGINIKSDLSMGNNYGEIPICYSEAYDVIYYINYSDNGFIYRCKDDEVEVAVKIPANNLYTKDGELYFRVTGIYDGLTGVSEGDICRYLPVTGKIEKLVENAAATWMTVSEDGIYYKDGSSVFYYDFETGAAEKVTAYSDMLLWKEDYAVIPYSSSLQGRDDGIIGIGLYKIGADYSEVEPLILDDRYYHYCVQGDVLYCPGETFNVIQFDTGEIKKYDNPGTKSGRSYGVGDFTIRNNRLYDQNLTCFIDLETGECHELYGETTGYFSRLFNVNNRIFGIYYEEGNPGRGSGRAEIVEIEVDEEPTLWQEGDVIYGERICYRLKKIGE